MCGERGGGGILMEGKGEGRRCSSAETQDEERGGNILRPSIPFEGEKRGLPLISCERRRKTL